MQALKTAKWAEQNSEWEPGNFFKKMTHILLRMYFDPQEGQDSSLYQKYIIWQAGPIVFESAVRVFQLQEQMPSNCSDLGIQGQERRGHRLDRWLDTASHCTPPPSVILQSSTGGGMGMGSLCDTINIHSRKEQVLHSPTTLSLAPPESAPSVESEHQSQSMQKQCGFTHVSGTSLLNNHSSHQQRS